MYPSILNRLMNGLAAGAVLLALGGCGGGQPARTTYDLTAPLDVARSSGSRAQLVVNEPTAVNVLDTDRILVREGASLSYLPDGQWADRLPKLVQTRLIQTFENATRLGRVGRPGDRVVPDYAVNLDIRTFGIEAQTNEARVEITVRIVSDRTGRVMAANAFGGRVPVGAVAGPQAAAALDQALSQVLRDIVRWAGRI